MIFVLFCRTFRWASPLFQFAAHPVCVCDYSNSLILSLESAGAWSWSPQRCTLVILHISKRERRRGDTSAGIGRYMYFAHTQLAQPACALLLLSIISPSVDPCTAPSARGGPVEGRAGSGCEKWTTEGRSRCVCVCSIKGGCAWGSVGARL